MKTSTQCEIRLIDGRATLVDADIAAEVGHLKWRTERKSGERTEYVVRRVKMKRRAYWFRLHRVILDAMPGFEVDHINGDGLDNRRENLRIVTRSQNQMNSRGKRGSSSRFKGVSWCARRGKWKVSVGGKDVRKTVGYFTDEAAAADAYDTAAREMFGEFARLNNARKATP